MLKTFKALDKNTWSSVGQVVERLTTDQRVASSRPIGVTASDCEQDTLSAA